MRDSRGRFLKKHKRAKTRRNPSKRRRARRASAAPRVNPRRRRRHVAARANPRRRRRAYRANPSHAIAANPKRRRRSRRSYRRNPGASVSSWLLAGAAAVGTTLAAGYLLPMIMPARLQQSPLLYGGVLGALGVGAGILLTKMGHPTLAVGIGIPLVALGGLNAYVGVSAALAAPAPKANPGRSFRAAYEQQKISGPTMGALAAFTPRNQGMGAVLQGAGFGTMAAVEAMIGDRSARPTYYGRAGEALGAR